MSPKREQLTAGFSRTSGNPVGVKYREDRYKRHDRERGGDTRPGVLG
jgi:hypothetical protein